MSNKIIDFYSEDDADDVADCVIDELPNGGFKIVMHVLPRFYGLLIGPKGQTKRRIETETYTKICIPRKQVCAAGKEDENITIEGSRTRSSVRAARRNILLIVHNYRNSFTATHTLGVALNFGKIRENFLEFKLTESVYGADKITTMLKLITRFL